MPDQTQSSANAAVPHDETARRDDRISPGIPASDAVLGASSGADDEADSSSMPSGDAPSSKRPDRSRLYGALSVALALFAAVAILAGAGYGAGLFAGAPDVSQGGEAPAKTDNATSSQSSDQGGSSAIPAWPASSSEEASSGGDAAQKADTPAISSADASAASSADSTSEAPSAPASASDNASSGADSSPSSADSASSEPAAQAPAELVDVPDVSPSEDAAQTENDGKIKVSVSVDSSRIADYGIDPFQIDQAVELDPGASVYDALCALGVPISGNSYYVSSINGLAERQGGQGSGWTYSVNGDFPSKSCGKYLLAGGEKIAWVYSTEKNPTLVMK